VVEKSLRKPDFDRLTTPAMEVPVVPGLSNFNLYAVTVLIWGSTWLAIKFQLGIVPPAVSVVWRFVLAALMLLAFARYKHLPLRFAAREHLWLALAGLSIFGINYVAVYRSEGFLTSGLVALVFALTTFLNIVFMRMFFGTPITARAAIGACIGIAGVALVFWPEVARFSASGSEVAGLSYALGGTVIASLGNMVAMRNHRAGMPVVQVNAWGMLYGAIAVALYAVIDGDRFAFDWSVPYVTSLLYLVLFGSVLAFGAYITLLGRIGAGRAGYVSIAIPVVALLLSMLVEGLQWQLTMIIGIALCLAGNLLVVSRRKA
jgi:drug/metabolite transporter (DMT)-like permease